MKINENYNERSLIIIECRRPSISNTEWIEIKDFFTKPIQSQFTIFFNYPISINLKHKIKVLFCLYLFFFRNFTFLGNRINELGYT